MRRILESFEEIACARPEIDDKGFCLGLTSARSKAFAVVIHDFTHSAERLVRELLRLLHDGGALPDDFIFTTIQVLRLQSKFNEKVRPHAGKGNVGVSLTVALGKFDGGALNLGGVSLNVKETPHIYDGHVVHFVEPFTGDRWSLTFFTYARYREASPQMVSLLRQLGFTLPSDLVPSAAPNCMQISATNVTSEGLPLFVEIYPKAHTAALAIGQKWKKMHHVVLLAPDDDGNASRRLYPDAWFSGLSTTFTK